MSEICLKISINKDVLNFEGGCLGDGFFYKELKEDGATNFDNLSLYLRHVDDPYINIMKF